MTNPTGFFGVPGEAGMYGPPLPPPWGGGPPQPSGVNQVLAQLSQGLRSARQFRDTQIAQYRSFMPRRLAQIRAGYGAGFNPLDFFNEGYNDYQSRVGMQNVEQDYQRILAQTRWLENEMLQGLPGMGAVPFMPEPEVEEDRDNPNRGNDDETDEEYQQDYEPSGSSRSGSSGLTKTDLDKGYKTGIIGAEEYVQGLIDYGMSPEDAALRARIYEGGGDTGTPTASLNMTETRGLFKSGELPFTDYVANLKANGKSDTQIGYIVRQDTGAQGDFSVKRATTISMNRRKDWRKLYFARRGTIPRLKAVSPQQRAYAKVRPWAQQLKDSSGKASMDEYLANVYQKMLKDGASPEDARTNMKDFAPVLSLAYTDAFKGKNAYVAKKDEAEKPASRAKRQELVKTGKRSFVNDANQKAFLAYKKRGGKLGPKTWYEKMRKPALKK